MSIAEKRIKEDTAKNLVEIDRLGSGAAAKKKMQSKMQHVLLDQVNS